MDAELYRILYGFHQAVIDWDAEVIDNERELVDIVKTLNSMLTKELKRKIYIPIEER